MPAQSILIPESSARDCAPGGLAVLWEMTRGDGTARCAISGDGRRLEMEIRMIDDLVELELTDDSAALLAESWREWLVEHGWIHAPQIPLVITAPLGTMMMPPRM